MAAISSMTTSSLRVAQLGGASASSLSSSASTAAAAPILRSCAHTGTAPTHSRRTRLVVEAKGRRNQSYGRRPQQMPEPPAIDPADDTPRFVLFIKTKAVNRWYPLSIVTGGTAAKMMLTVMRTDIGNKLYGNTLTRNIASVIYKDEKALCMAALKQYPVLKGASGYDYGFKIMDPKNPRASMFGSDVTKIPPESELVTVFDKARRFVDEKFGSAKEAFGKLSSLPAADVAAAADPPRTQDGGKK